MKDLSGAAITDPVERGVLFALRANTIRPEGLPLIEEEELDAYVLGVEQAARMICEGFDRLDLAEKWLDHGTLKEFR